MSRQIRRQIPQKQKKKRVDRNACLLVFILIFSGILTFLLLTARDNSKLNSTLDETFDFVKNRIESYEIYNTNDQVKSLVRLLDKTTELSRVIEQEGNLSTEMLDEYAREQRLTGILVLDQNLKVTEQSAKDGDTMSLWQKLIKSDYVRDIAEHPEKTYTTRLRNKGKIYDFAAVARQDAAGILITYAQKEEVNELNGDLTMASLFSDFPFEMNGSVVICDDDKVVSTNRQELTARSIEEAKSQYKNKFEVDENGIVHLRSETGNWFGRREKIKDYDAYIFFPESQVYITRNIICVIYVLLALLLFLLYRVSRSRTEKRSILQDQKRLRVINALGHAYASISLVNLKTEEIEILKSSGNMKPDQKGDMLFKAHQEELIRQVIAEPFQKAYWEFVDISTVAKRLEERETLSFTARTVDERWMTMIIVPQGYDKDGKLCTVLVAIRDATEEKEREIAQDRNLRNALAAAEHANRAKTVFLNNMSHDIRTPINGIIGMLTILKKSGNDGERAKDCLNKINESSKLLLSLVNDVLDMAKLESDTVVFSDESINLDQVCQEITESLSFQAEEKGLHVIGEHDDYSGIYVWSNAVHLKKILMNLFTNSMKYNKVNGFIYMSMRTIERSEDHMTCEFKIKDNGIGMSEEFIKNELFTPFVQADNSPRSDYNGTGLGMPIVKQLVEKMGGTITVESKLGEGSCFTVILPFKIDTNARPEEKEDFDADISDIRVLLVEDNELNVEIAEFMLTENGAKVETVNNGLEAVQHFEASEPGTYDVILMDVMMPVMDGLTATKTIRSLERQDAKTIPIIAMTANAFREDAEKCMEAGMNAHLAKPLDDEKIKQTISEELRKQNACHK